MTGIERLRAISGARDEWVLGGTIAEIADQIERELQEERDRWDSELCEAQMDKSRVTVVYLEMNKHVLGHEGMEDSPVARWARELREALGGAVTDEDREAAEWVRKRGGIDYVKGEWRSRVPYDRYERRRQRLLGHIAECEAALRRRNQRIEKMGHRVSDLTTENAELRKRAMPEGMEWLLEVWPRWSNGEYCRFGDWWTADRYGDYEPRQLRRLVIYTPELLDEWEQGDGESYGYEWDFMRPSELGYRPDKAVAPEPAVVKTEIDSWERIEEDALNFVEDNAGMPHDQDQMERDMLSILRRCRALAERERGE